MINDGLITWVERTINSFDISSNDISGKNCLIKIYTL